AFRLIRAPSQESAGGLVIATLIKDDSSVGHRHEGVSMSAGGACLPLGFLQGRYGVVMLPELPKCLAKIVERDSELREKPVFSRDSGCPSVKWDGLLAPPQLSEGVPSLVDRLGPCDFDLSDCRDLLRSNQGVESRVVSPRLPAPRIKLEVGFDEL